MSIISFVASKLNHVDEFKLIYFCLPLLYLEYKKNNKEVFLAFFKIFLSFNLSVLVKGVLRIPHPVYTHTFAFPSAHCWMVPFAIYAILFCLIQEKKICIIWTVFAGLMEIFICVYNAHHTLLDCFGGLTCCLISLVVIELYLKQITYKNEKNSLYHVAVHDGWCSRSAETKSETAAVPRRNTNTSMVQRHVEGGREPTGTQIHTHRLRRENRQQCRAD